MRASGNKYGAKTTTEMRNVESEDVEELALMLLNDPRDKVLGVYVWSEREEQFVTSYSKPATEATKVKKGKAA
jgi:hypothetical protein